MELQAVVQVLMTERKPDKDEELTAASQKQLELARSLVDQDPALPAFTLLSLAVRLGASEVFIDCANRKLNLRFSKASIPADFVHSPELLEWWWTLIARDCKGWLAVMRNGQIDLLGWDGKQVVRNSGPAPEEFGCAVEFQAALAELQSPVFNAMADKQLLDAIKASFVERARVYPLPLYFNGVLWEWPLDIKLERVCVFTSYALIGRDDGEVGFAVAQPWAHGCRYWLTRDGRIVDMVSKGATDTQNASGNICHMPALRDHFPVQRRLNFLRKRDDAGIELSAVRSVWGKSSYLAGFEELLLSPRTVVFGQSPPVRLQMRPLRVRQLLMQTDRTNEANVIVPVRDGLTLDPVFVTSNPGGIHALAVVPDELVSTRQGRTLADKEAAQRWARGLVTQGQALQKPLME